MTTIAAGRPVAARRRSSAFVGTIALLRLNLRRERLPLVLWVAGLAGIVMSTMASLAALVPTEADRVELATGLAVNPGMVVLLGHVQSTSMGGLISWRVGIADATLIALMAILTVVRRTRADEESGRTELLVSAVVGRGAPLAAALVTAGGACVVVGVLVAGSMIANGYPAAGSWAFGAALAGTGLVYGALAAVVAQLVENSRAATALTGAALAIGYAVRAVGDVNDRLSWLSWVSPQGWFSRTGAYAGNHFGVLGLSLAATAALTGIALWLLNNRDLGAGLLAVGLGPASSRSLRSPFALALRLQRTSLLSWTVGMVALGAVVGSIGADAGSLLADSPPKMVDIIRKLGGPGAIGDAFLGAMGAIVAMIAAGQAVSTALRLRSEETSGRLEPLLATAVDRRRWMAGHLLFVVFGPLLTLAAAGLVTGLVYGGRTGDLASGVSAGFQSVIVQWPAVLVLGAVAAAVFGVLPRFTGIAWGALGVAIVLGQFGTLFGLPRVLLDLSPFTHIPALPSAQMQWLPVTVLVVIAAALMGVGVVAFRRRDVG